MSFSTIINDFLIGSACDVGKKRKSNQDALDVLLPEAGIDVPPLLVVADGMGGHNGGETASRLVVEAFREVYVQLQPPLDAARALKMCVQRSHEALRAQAAEDSSLKGMGSTVVAAFCKTTAWTWSTWATAARTFYAAENPSKSAQIRVG